MRGTAYMATRLIALPVAIALALGSAAFAAQRRGDVDAIVELEAIARAVSAIQDDRLSRCGSATGEIQFELYRQYDGSIGRWHSLASLRDLVDLAVESQSPLDEQRIRAAIVDHARFVVWELDEHVAQLMQTLFSRGPTPDWELRDEIRLARQARDVAQRLIVERALP